MAQRGVSHDKRLLIVGDANEPIKQQIAIRYKAPFGTVWDGFFLSYGLCRA